MKLIKLNRIILILISALILIVPDIILNYSSGFFIFTITLAYKIAFYLFLWLLVLRMTKSYFRAYLITGIPYLIASFVEVINVIALRSYSTLDNIKGLYFTLGSEAGEFFSKFYIYFLILLAIVIAYIFSLIKFKSIKYDTSNQNRLWYLSIGAILVSSLLSFYKLSTTPLYISGKNIITTNVRDYYLKQHPLSVYYRTYELVCEISRTNKFKPLRDHFSFGVVNPKNAVRPNVVVLIIGERTRYSNWSINGYDRETSPNLKKVENLISFNNNFSNANSTANSFPLIITQATPQTPDLAYKQKSIVSLYKEAGYETIWISSQANCFKFIDNKNEMDVLYELYNKKGHSDLDVITKFNEVVQQKTSKNRLIVINMLGGHGNIPKSFNRFTPNTSQKNYPITFENAPIFINDYDNMMLLQDYVLSQLIKTLDQQSLSSVLLFTADHGCNLFDNGKVLFGYGSAHPTEKETHVPLLVWGSNKFIEENNDKYDNLKKHKNLLTTNNNIFSTLADLSNIRYKSFVTKESIANSAYIEPKTRYVFVNNGVMEFKK